MTHTNALGEDKQMLWDEKNMMKAIKIAEQSFQHYIYDANGERTLKGQGEVNIITLNGGAQSVTASVGNYSIYASGYLVVGSNGMVTKHYYSGSERIVSRLAGPASGYNQGQTQSGTQSASLPARQLQDITYVFDQFALGAVNITDAPPSPADCEVNGTCASVLYFFHSDHLGSSTFLTDAVGVPYQFLLYLPFGESMAEQKAGSWAAEYKYTGKELDEETGLYYYGARYYDASVSLWYGVDQLAHKYPEYSPYVYVANNPIKFIDPDGRKIVNPYSGYAQYKNLESDLKSNIKNAKRGRERRAARKELRNNKSNIIGYNMFSKTNSLIEEFKSKNEAEFNRVDNLQLNGKEIDVVVNLALSDGGARQAGETVYKYSAAMTEIDFATGEKSVVPTAIEGDKIDVNLFFNGQKVGTLANEFGDAIFAVENPKTSQKDNSNNVSYMRKGSTRFSFDYENYIMNGGTEPNPKDYE